MFSLASKLVNSLQTTIRLSLPTKLTSHSFSAISCSPQVNLFPSQPMDVPRRFVRIYEEKQYFGVDGTKDLPVKEVLKRFKRLRSGIYIHAIPGRKKHLYRKTDRLRNRLSEHIFTDRNSSFLYDNMLNKSCRRPKFYPEDPYEPYHTRTGVPWDYANKKRRFYP